jgi:hypothetical protein
MGFLLGKKRNEIQAGDSLWGPRNSKAHANSDEYRDDHGNLVVDITWVGNHVKSETLPADMFTPTRMF